MKVATRNSNTLIEGEVETVKMSVSAKGMNKMTRMLRDQIYTYKQWAVVREIIANAIDEHTKHNIDRPVEIKLPTAQDAHFRVRDFAKGLSKENVFNVFFQYFESTKDQDNHGIGGFGIGAKAPLCYAPMFFVDSYHSGEKTCYACNVNGEASTAHKMGLTDSTETGIEVSVPVESKDFSLFNQLVAELLYFSKWNAKVTNVSDESLIKPEPQWKMENELGYVGSTDSRFHSHNDVVARINGILYKVDDHEEIQNPFYGQLVLDIPADEEIEIHPSRERIELSKRNIHKVAQAIEKFLAFATKETKAKLDAAKTAREKFAVSFDSSAFRNNASIKNIGVPSVISAEPKNIEFITWDASMIDRYKVSKMKRHNYGGDTLSIKPSGIKISQEYQQNKTYYKPEGSVVVAKADKLNSHQLIAFAEKNNIPSPVFCVRGMMADPEGWVEGSDFWTFEDDSVTKDETKVVRQRYVVPSTGKRSKQAPAQNPKEVIGYAHARRSNYHTFRIEKLEEGKRLLVLPMAGHEIQKIARWFFSDMFANTHQVVYAFETHIKRIKKLKLPADFASKDFFKPCAQAYINDVQAVNLNDSGFNIEYGQDFKAYELNSKYEGGLKNEVLAIWPDLKPNKVNPKIQKWEDAKKRFVSLTPLQQETVQLAVCSSNYYARRNCPELVKEGKRLLSEKVFV
ncbi:ATP-binding protein [bacterium]|nr:ATP-binding protein [bacterium]